MLMTLLPLFLATVLGVAGQLLLKQGMSQMGALQLSASAVPSLLWRMATSPYVVGGLLIYGTGTFFWLIFISRVPLSYSYPFVSLGIVLGLFSAWAGVRPTSRSSRPTRPPETSCSSTGGRRCTTPCW